MSETCLVPANRKGGKVLISDGFRYRRKSANSRRFQWICTEAGCGAYLFTNCFDYEREDIVGKGTFMPITVGSLQYLTSVSCNVLRELSMSVCIVLYAGFQLHTF
jgi:hypothetical protein